MLGQLCWSRGRWGGGEAASFYGLPVLRAESDPAGWFRPCRLRRAGKTLCRGGVRRVLTPPDFSDWPIWEPFGLGPVSPEPLVRFRAAELALAALERRGLDPERAAVALRGSRVDLDLEWAAAVLCPRVRRLIVGVPSGGPGLAAELRSTFGVPVLPPEEAGDLALYFSPVRPIREPGPELFGLHPRLDGLTLSAPALAEEDRTALPVLTALWQGGVLGAGALKIVGIP